MNPIDINKLQVLNDLVAQTIDIINQRNFASPFVGAYQGAGLSHTPFTPYAQPWAPFGQPMAQPGISPWGPSVPTPLGGISHTPADPRLVDPRFSVATQPWPAMGLSHTPYVDPRWAYAQQPIVPMLPFVR